MTGAGRVLNWRLFVDCCGVCVARDGAATFHIYVSACSCDNALFPSPSFSSCAIDTESNTLYWGTVFTIPAGATLTLEGQFPHSRYMSFISYDEMGRPIQSVADYLIKPSAGSRNPFITGADRTVTKRDYRLEVVPARPDSNVPTGMSAADKVSVKLQACPSVHCRSSRTLALFQHQCWCTIHAGGHGLTNLCSQVQARPASHPVPHLCQGQGMLCYRAL
jgi:hypothetical protein